MGMTTSGFFKTLLSGVGASVRLSNRTAFAGLDTILINKIQNKVGIMYTKMHLSGLRRVIFIRNGRSHLRCGTLPTAARE
jgi:hypothetical protein